MKFGSSDYGRAVKCQNINGQPLLDAWNRAHAGLVTCEPHGSALGLHQAPKQENSHSHIRILHPVRLTTTAKSPKLTQEYITYLIDISSDLWWLPPLKLASCFGSVSDFSPRCKHVEYTADTCRWWPGLALHRLKCTMATDVAVQPKLMQDTNHLYTRGRCSIGSSGHSLQLATTTDSTSSSLNCRPFFNAHPNGGNHLC